MELNLATVRLPASLDAASTRALGAAIAEGIAEAAARPGGVLVLEGGHGGFCRGMDTANLDPGEVEGALARFAELLVAVRGAPVATLAAIDGDALGGGLGLAAACDIVITTRASRFGLPEALFGLVPAMVLPVVAERIGRAAARRLALTARSRSAAEAVALGLADRVTAELDRAIREEARGLARVAPASVRWLRAIPPALEAEIRAGAAATAAALAHPDARARLTAYAAGRAPWEVGCPS